MGIFGKKKEVTKINLMHVDGLRGYGEAVVVINLDDINKCITISPKVYKVPPVHLKYEQIVGVNVVSEKEIIEKNKSAIGRAAVGGVLLGPLGAIIGGMSGIGNKQKSEVHYYMVINYKSRDDELKVLSFEIVGFSNWAKFVKELKGKINNQSVIENTEVYL